jgi:hypothetical protein
VKSVQPDVFVNKINILTECSILDHFILSALAAIEPEESNGGRGAKFTSD